MEKMKLTNSNQFAKLVEELEKNPSLARGFRRVTVPSNFKEQWSAIALSLNAMGPPRRNEDGWQKVWLDLKFKVKKKLVSNKAECNATGGGVYKQFVLSPLEEAVSNMLQFEKQLNPEGAVQGVQFYNPADECEILESTLDLEPEFNEVVECRTIDLLNESESIGFSQQSKPITNSMLNDKRTPLKCKNISSLPKNKGKSNDRLEILQKHSDEHAKLLTEMSNSLSSVKRSLRDENKYQKELLDIKKKFKLLEERCKRESEIHETELKIKRMKLLIKEKELKLVSKSQD